VFIFYLSYSLFEGYQGVKAKELTWGSHVNKSFMDIIQAVYENDLMKAYTNMDVFNPFPQTVSGKIVFIYPFGLCFNFKEYNPDQDFLIRIEESLLQGTDYEPKDIFENMLVFITDPAMLTFSSIDQQSHQGNQIFGMKKGRKTFYNVEVCIKDSDNPTERDTCSLTPYSDCVDQQTHQIFTEVIL